MDGEELDQVKKKVMTYMKEQYKSLGVNMLYFMLTDIIKPGTELLCVGDGAMELVEVCRDRMMLFIFRELYQERNRWFLKL